MGVVLRNSKFGDRLWDPEPKNGSWSNVYSLQHFEQADIPYESIWALDGFNDGDNFMGQRLLRHATGRTVLDFLKIRTVDHEESVRLAALARSMGDVVSAEQFAKANTSYQRHEGTTYVYRAESILITAYRASLPDDQGQTLRVPTGVADFYAEEAEGSVIVEAKSSAEHHYVRQALSQLLDYARFSPRPVARLGALFPQCPDQRGLDLLHDYGIDCIYLNVNNTFATLPAPIPARSLWQKPAAHSDQVDGADAASQSCGSDGIAAQADNAATSPNAAMRSREDQSQR